MKPHCPVPVITYNGNLIVAAAQKYPKVAARLPVNYLTDTAVLLEADPAAQNAHQPAAIFVHFERVEAAQIGGYGRGRVHHERARRRPDKGVDQAVLERHALLVRAGALQAQAAIGLHVDDADIADVYGDMTACAGFKGLADGQAAGSGPRPR